MYWIIPSIGIVTRASMLHTTSFIVDTKLPG